MIIMTDTSALFTVDEGKKIGIEVIPLCVSINKKQLRDLECDTKAFLKEVRDGAIPQSSQPPIGEVIERYERYQNEDILHICMADGLSGTFQSTLSARQQVENQDRICVLNSQTLCGPQRYLVEKTVKLRSEGCNREAILKKLHDSMEHMHSFLIPQDFEFLKRGGRLNAAAAVVGGFLKLKPVMETVENGSRLGQFTIARTLNKALGQILSFMETQIQEDVYRIYVSHADAFADAKKMLDQIKTRFAHCEVEMLELSPAFITQGGPSCIAIQYIKK